MWFLHQVSHDMIRKVARTQPLTNLEGNKNGKSSQDDFMISESGICNSIRLGRTWYEQICLHCVQRCGIGVKKIHHTFFGIKHLAGDWYGNRGMNSEVQP